MLLVLLGNTAAIFYGVAIRKRNKIEAHLFQTTAVNCNTHTLNAIHLLDLNYDNKYNTTNKNHT